MSTNPASASQRLDVVHRRGAGRRSRRSASGRPAGRRGSSAMLTTSEIASRPPGFSTRKASRNTCALSGARLTTQLEMMTSAVASAIGRCSISPRRNSTLAAPTLAALARALASISCVMSTPITCPAGPTWRAARKQSKPAPLPRSTHDLAGPHGGDRLRVAAAEAEIGAVRNGRQLRLGVAHAARFVGRDVGGIATAEEEAGRSKLRLRRRRCCRSGRAPVP